MRILHTSDWHLGRLLHNVHLTEDQAYVLDDLVRLVADARPDVVIVAGDLYDRAVPPPEAVALLDEVLARIVLDRGVPVVAIAGNHDSPERVGFAARLLADRGLHLIGPLGRARAIHLADAHGPVHLVPLPYASPEAVRSAFAGEEARGHDEALRAQVTRAVDGLGAGRRVAIAHAFVTGGAGSESERPLVVGGTGEVDASAFDGFAYAALGHLHRPQAVGEARVRYSGSLLPYSFAEVDHRKTVSLVELDAQGGVTSEEVPLRARRAMRVVEGTLDELLAADVEEETRHDYLLARLMDTRPVLDAMARLRERYPNVLHIERPALMPDGPLEPRADHRKMEPLDLFADFWEQVKGEPLEDDLRGVVAGAIEGLGEEGRR